VHYQGWHVQKLYISWRLNQQMMIFLLFLSMNSLMKVTATYQGQSLHLAQFHLELAKKIHVYN